MNDSTKDKIQSVLSELIDRKRFIFWYDEGGQMNEFVSALEIPGVEILTLNQNAFTNIEYSLVNSQREDLLYIVRKADQTMKTTGYLIWKCSQFHFQQIWVHSILQNVVFLWN